ncbi:WXG100 family type VII secretion target [Rhodococcus sp. HNM0569]|uniref:WXG100 family type VII secretion target n=1 Tax=Rhodococcus sp. HNM0569 TaxID=2716340 RepID=UPI00146F2651|nr:WXG100 family type VII secretion target [Rhodococcus sp. HNM0569]NLU82101.1 WXG100 family type VII secretion target [Rhodococcus sp. HNM0569]
MSDRLRVDLEQFRALVPEFDDLESHTTSVRSALTQGLDGEGECWGADEVGAAFAAKYVAPAEDTIEAVTLLARIFSLIGDKVDRTADSFAHTDARTGDTLGWIDPGVGG